MIARRSLARERHHAMRGPVRQATAARHGMEPRLGWRICVSDGTT